MIRSFRVFFLLFFFLFFFEQLFHCAYPTMGIDLRPRRAAPRRRSFVRANYVFMEFAWRYFDGTHAVHVFIGNGNYKIQDT